MTRDIEYTRECSGSVDQAVERLRAELGARGFGVLAALPVHTILQEKLGRTIDPVVILEVCSPAHAARALDTTRDAALLLPCKIVVHREGDRTCVSLQRPTTALAALLPDSALAPLGREVEELLVAAIDGATAGVLDR